MNTAPTGTSPTPTVAPNPWGSTFGGYTNAPDYTDPRSQQWNFQIERQISASSMASIAYVGSHTQRLEWCCNANYPQGGPFCQNNPAQGYTCPTTPLTPNQINQRQYMPFAAQGWNYSQSTGYSSFHALEAQYQKRFSHGLQTLVAFTWEKCLGDSNGDFNAENGSEAAPYEYYFKPSPSRGICTFDIPKLFTWTSVYQLPSGHGQKWLSHGWMSRAFGNRETNYSFIARSGQAFNPSWGGASSICTASATNCVPATIGGVAPTSTDPANLSKCRRSDHRLQSAERAPGVPADHRTSNHLELVQPSLLRQSVISARRTGIRFWRRPHRQHAFHAIYQYGRRAD